jgi:hypothetical protein
MSPIRRKFSYENKGDQQWVKSHVTLVCGEKFYFQNAGHL